MTTNQSEDTKVCICAVLFSIAFVAISTLVNNNLTKSFIWLSILCAAMVALSIVFAFCEIAFNKLTNRNIVTGRKQ